MDFKSLARNYVTTGTYYFLIRNAAVTIAINEALYVRSLCSWTNEWWYAPAFGPATARVFSTLFSFARSYVNEEGATKEPLSPWLRVMSPLITTVLHGVGFYMDYQLQKTQEILSKKSTADAENIKSLYRDYSNATIALNTLEHGGPEFILKFLLLDCIAMPPYDIASKVRCTAMLLPRAQAFYHLFYERYAQAEEQVSSLLNTTSTKNYTPSSAITVYVDYKLLGESQKEHDTDL